MNKTILIDYLEEQGKRRKPIVTCHANGDLTFGVLSVFFKRPAVWYCHYNNGVEYGISNVYRKIP